MKTIILFVAILFLASCSKEKCWMMTDCMGNDVGEYCGSETEIKNKVASLGTPGCQYTYRSAD